MKRWTIKSVAVAVTVLAVAAPAVAAKGVITEVNPSGVGGIVVTEPREAGGREIGLRTGDAIRFRGETAGATVGDLVSFDVVLEADPAGGPIAVDVRLDVRAALVEGTVRGGFMVRSGQVLVVRGGGVVNGTILVKGGTLVLMDGARVTGQIRAQRRASVVIADHASLGRGFDMDDSYFTVRSPNVFQGGLLAQGYCVKCKAKKEMSDATEVVMKNQRRAERGTCPTCGTGMFRILGKA